jgi:hypothetical protein
MGLTPKEMKIAMDAGKVIATEDGKFKAFLRGGEYLLEYTEYKKVETLALAWLQKNWQIYEEPKPVFPFKAGMVCIGQLSEGDENIWKVDFYSHLTKYGYSMEENRIFACVGMVYKKIAPLEGNEDFTTNPDGVKGIWTREML